MLARISWLGCAALLCGALVSAASADVFGSGANQFTIDFVTIYGSTNPPVGPGRIEHDYRIAVTEVTNAQWDAFVAELGVPVTGNPRGAYDDPPYWTGPDVPANEISWHEAAQFVNWLNETKGHQAAYRFVGTQGESAYSLSTWSAAEAEGGTNLYRHKDAFYYLPTEDEFLKAGYWNGTDMQTYATQDGSAPIEDVEAKYGAEPGEQPWAVGSGAPELNGTRDMMGNVWEWMENPFDDGNYEALAWRALRGGAYNTPLSGLQSGVRMSSPTYYREYYGTFGFRVASDVPEPVILGDLNKDGRVDNIDIDLMQDALANGTLLDADLDGDGDVDADDRDMLVRELIGPGSGDTYLALGTEYGDATIDGKVDAADLSLLATNWQTPSGLLWADADFTGDGGVDAADLSLLAANWQFDAQWPVGSPVPEPGVLTLLALVGVDLLRRRCG